MNNKYTEEQEGYSDVPYTDTQGNPTVGYGSNLNSPEVPALLEKQGISHEQLLSGERKLSSEEAKNLMDAQMMEKERLLNHKLKTMAPNAQLEPHEKQILMDMMYNSPELVGPNMLDFLNRNRKLGAAKEILTNSNKEGSPGLQTRRIENAQMFAGENWPDVVANLTTAERQEIRDIIKQIKNPHERLRVFQQYPWLEQVAMPRYGRMMKD